MGKAARIKAERQEEQQEQGPRVLNTINFNILSDGHVNVSGPITNPVFVMHILSKGLNALAVYYAQEQEKASPIIQPQPGIVLPGGN